jgi:hypothetical protein
VFFQTAEAIPGTGDNNTTVDAYERSLAVPSLAGQTAVAGTPSVGSRLTCAVGAVVGERVTVAVAWLRDGAPIADASGSSRPRRQHDR